MKQSITAKETWGYGDKDIDVTIETITGEHHEICETCVGHLSIQDAKRLVAELEMAIAHFENLNNICMEHDIQILE